MIKILKNQTELIRTCNAKSWHYDKAESRHFRIWGQLVKKLGNPDPESMDLLYCGYPHKIYFYFKVDIGITYKMMHNNDPAEVHEYA